MRGHENGLIPLNGINGDLLEGVEREFVFPGRFGWRDVLGYGNVVVAWRNGDLMSDLEQKGWMINIDEIYVIEIEGMIRCKIFPETHRPSFRCTTQSTETNSPHCLPQRHNPQNLRYGSSSPKGEELPSENQQTQKEGRHNCLKRGPDPRLTSHTHRTRPKQTQLT